MARKNSQMSNAKRIGKKVAKVNIFHFLGAGGFGKVFRLHPWAMNNKKNKRKHFLPARGI